MNVPKIRYLKEKEVSEITGIAIQTLRNQRCAGDPNTIPYIRIGKKMIRYDSRDVHAFMDERRVGYASAEKKGN